MNYPLLSEYVESIKSAEDNLAELSNLHPVLDANGDPVMTGGNFAVVFKMQDKNTGKYYALKCFTREQEGRAESYKLIAEDLGNVEASYLTHFRYYDNELFVDCANTVETEFPVVLMDWVEGLTLGEYIREHIGDQYALEMLAYQFSRLAIWLLPQPFAHGDLKPDNIIVKDDGSLVLVDYDGMYVPAMKGQKARELGSPDFRHPSRTENDFDEHIDDFAISVILLSLKAISLSPNLFSVYGNNESLLFSAKDYVLLSESQAINNLFSLMNDYGLAKAFSLFLLTFSQNIIERKEVYLVKLDNFPKIAFDYALKKVNLGRYKEAFDIWLPLAEEGNAKAQNNVGYLYLKGKGVNKDEDKAKKWLTLAKEQSYYKAFWWLGILYEEKKEYSNAYELFKEAADFGNDERAQYKIGVYYEKGIFVDKDESKAFDFYKKSAEHNLVLSQRKLGDIFREGLLGKRESPKESIFWFMKAAEQGDSTSQFKVGYFYYKGYGVDSDYVEAVKWYKLAAEQNNIAALNNLGVCYEYGRGVESNKAIAVSYYEKSAVLGNIVAQRNLSNCYLNGLGIEKNLEKAFEWRLKAANNHDISSQVKLSEWNFKGVGTNHDKEQALIWYTKSKLQGDIKDVVIDTMTAINALAELADNNDTLCQYIIGKCYEYGVGVLKDKEKANAWFEMALDNGFTEAYIKLRRIPEYSTKQSDECKRIRDYNHVYYSADYSEVIGLRGFDELRNLDSGIYKIRGGTRIILDDAFSNLLLNGPLKKIVIPSSVVLIGKNPFNFRIARGFEFSIECKSHAYYVKDSALYSKEGKRLISYFGSSRKFIIPDGVEIVGESAFSNNGIIETISFPQSLRIIEDEAFRECKSVKSIDLPRSVSCIGKNVFYGCTNLEDVISLGSVTVIPEYAFARCDIKRIKLPDELLVIKSAAFRENSFTEVIIPNKVKEIGNSAFEKCHSLTSLFIPGSVTSLGVAAFSDCNLKSVVLNEGLLTIESSCFSHNPIDCIDIPNSVTEIGANPFRGVRQLLSKENERYRVVNNILFDRVDNELISYFGNSRVSIPDNIISIRKDSFYNSNITVVSGGKNLKKIRDYAFGFCGHLKNVCLNQSAIEIIPEKAFYDCDKLKSIDLPETIKEIQAYAFLGCERLTDIYVRSKNLKADYSIFERPLEYFSFDDIYLSVSEKDIMNAPKIYVHIPKGTSNNYNFHIVEGDKIGFVRNVVLVEEDF